MNPTIDDTVFVNFGAGVQSTAIALMVINRDPRLGQVLPAEFIFADTGDEPADIYPHVEKIGRMLRAAGHDFTIVRKQDRHARLSDALINAALSGTSGGVACPPAFAFNGRHKRGIAMRRTCTKEWKVRPIERHIIERMTSRYADSFTTSPVDGDGVQYREAVQWIGYSADEADRRITSDQRWRYFRYPLIEARMTRADCHAIIERSQYDDGSPMKPMRSACVYCPYHSRYAWERVAQNPDDWALALRVDEALEEGFNRHGKMCGMRMPLFLTPQGWRLRDAGFDDPVQSALMIEDDDRECESGVCGV